MTRSRQGPVLHSLQEDGTLRLPQHSERTFERPVLDLLVCDTCGALLPNDDYFVQLHMTWHQRLEADVRE